MRIITFALTLFTLALFAACSGSGSTTASTYEAALGLGGGGGEGGASMVEPDPEPLSEALVIDTGFKPEAQKAVLDGIAAAFAEHPALTRPVRVAGPDEVPNVQLAYGPLRLDVCRIDIDATCYEAAPDRLILYPYVLWPSAYTAERLAAGTREGVVALLSSQH